MPYLDYEIFDTPPDWSNDPALTPAHAAEIVSDLGLGAARDLAATTRYRLTFSYTNLDRAARTALLAFFDARAGRFGAFWSPSWRTDLQLAEAFAAIDTVLYIEDVGYAANWLGEDATGRHLLLYWPDGSYVARKVVDAEDGLEGDHEGQGSVTLDSAPGAAGAANEVMVMFLHFARFDVDEVELEHESADISGCELTLLTIPGEAPL